MKNFLINEHSHHIWIIINWKKSLYHLGQSPKCFFLSHSGGEKSSCNKVHTLTVAYCRISNYVASQHVTKRFDIPFHLGFILKIWIGPFKIKFNLLKTWIRIREALILQSIIITWIIFHLNKSIRTLEPNQLVMMWFPQISKTRFFKYTPYNIFFSFWHIQPPSWIFTVNYFTKLFSLNLFG